MGNRSSRRKWLAIGICIQFGNLRMIESQTRKEAPGFCLKNTNIGHDKKSRPGLCSRDSFDASPCHHRKDSSLSRNPKK